MSTAVRPLILIGAGGHARVLLALARARGCSVLGVCDPRLTADSVARWEDLDVLGDDSMLDQLPPDRVSLMLGIGQRLSDNLRTRLFTKLRARGYDFPTLIHPSAWVAPDVALADGVQVMAGAIIQPGCEIGENCIVNTRASIDHDCRIGQDVHIAPGATLCGTVTVKDGAFIGAGATVIQGLQVGARTVIGAGVTLLRDSAPEAIIIGAANRLR